MESSYNRLWEDSMAESPPKTLKVEQGGAIPSWLKGTLIRNGPGCFGTNERKYLHLFDGLAKLTRFAFSGAGDEIIFSAKFIRSNFFQKIVGENCMPPSVTTGPVSPPWSLLESIQGAFMPTVTFDNTPVNIHQMGGPGGRLVAVTDAPVAMEFDPATLETIGRVTYKDAITSGSLASKELFSTAHPHTSREGYTINYFLELDPLGSNAALIVQTDKEMRRKVVGKVPINFIPYIHDISVTDTKAVLCIWPFRVNQLSLFNGKGFLPQLDWKVEDGTKILIFDLDKTDAGPIAEYQAPAMFAYHHVNAWDTPSGDVVFDVSGYKTPGIVNGEHLFALLPNVKDPSKRGLQESDASWFRYTIPLSVQKRGLVSPVELKAVLEGQKFTAELVTINPRFQRRENRYSYGFTGFAGVGADRGGFLEWGIVKLDHQAAHRVAAEQLLFRPTTAQVWKQPHCYPSEPIMVPHPCDVTSVAGEDDGVVLSQVYDADRQDSFLLVLDAKSMTELARVYLGMVCPASFHGKWIAP